MTWPLVVPRALGPIYRNDARAQAAGFLRSSCTPPISAGQGTCDGCTLGSPPHDGSVSR